MDELKETKLLKYHTLLFILFHDIKKPWVIEKSCTQHKFISLTRNATDFASQYFLKHQERTQIKKSMYHGAQQVWHLDLSKTQQQEQIPPQTCCQ